jgi:hypothetical protein
MHWRLDRFCSQKRDGRCGDDGSDLGGADASRAEHAAVDAAAVSVILTEPIRSLNYPWGFERLKVPRIQVALC